MRFWIALLPALVLVGCSLSGGPSGTASRAPAAGLSSEGATGKPPGKGAQGQPSGGPEAQPTQEPCVEVLAEVRPMIGSDWVQTESGPCWTLWEKQETDYYLSIAWSSPDGSVQPLTTESIQLGRYQGRLDRQQMEKTGAPFWGPTGWTLEVAGERGRITLTCGMQMAPNLEEGKARQLEVDARCPELLRGTTVFDLGQPLVPPEATSHP